MVDAWPASLPEFFEIGGFSEGFPDGLIETQPDQGPAQTRRRFTATVRPVSGSMQVSQDQLDDLREFVDATLMGGSLPFTIPAATEAGVWLVKFTKGGLPKVSALGLHYRVTFSIVVLP